MPHWEINDNSDVIGITVVLVILILAVVGAVLVTILKRRITVKKGKDGLVVMEGPQTDPTAPTLPCEPFVKEHTAILQRVDQSLDRIEAILSKAMERINATDESQGALIAQAAIMNKFVRRELGRVREGEKDVINGDLDEADEEINRAKEIYRQGRRL